MAQSTVESPTLPSKMTTMMQFAAFAARHLRVLELAEAVRYSTNGCTNDSHGKTSLKDCKDAVLALSGTRFKVLPDETVLVTAHNKTDESDDHLQQGLAHARLAIACLQYLIEVCAKGIKPDTSQQRPLPRVGSTWIGPPRDPDDIIELRLQYPFLKYASSQWFRHVVQSAAAGQPQAEINQQVAKLVDMRDNMRIWLHVDWLDGHGSDQGFTKLHIAAMLGLVAYTKTLLESKAIQVDERDSNGRTAM